MKGNPDKPSEPDPGILANAEFWPGKYHELLTVQSNRGYQIAYVHLFPLQYLPQTGEIRAAGKLRLKVNLVGRNKPHRTKPTKKLKKKLKRKIDNPDTLTSYDTYSDQDSGIPAKSSNGSSPLSDPAGPYYGANYKYVVITSSALANENNIPDPAYSFQALCASKIARGISAGIVTTDWIIANYDGTKPSGGSDNATRIRNFLIDAYQTWDTEYALLGGDKDIVPVRLFEDSGDSIPADLYYGCVDPPENTFDGDGDGVYGESKDGPGGADVDLTAEIFTGRAAVENGREVVNFVRKTLTYESTDDDYLNVAATMGSHLGFGKVQEFTKPFGELIRLGSDLYLGHFTHGIETPNIPNARDFSVITMYDEDWYNDNHEPDFDRNGSVDWDSYSDGWSATDDLLPILNAEYGNQTPQIIYISDHGDTHLGMVKLYSYNTSGRHYSHIGNLKNTNPFFFYDDSCWVGAYDENDSFGEEITTMEHGAFATILNSRYGWGASGNKLDSPSTQFTREFFHSVFGEGILELGRAHQEAKESNLWRLYTSFWGVRYIYYELNLFGDPELRLRVTEDSGCTDGDTRPTTCGTGACASSGIQTCTDGMWGGDTCEEGAPSSETCNYIDDDCDGSVDELECVVLPENHVLPENGGVLESFTSEYGSGYDASDLTNGVTNEAGWSSAVNPGPQQFVYSFLNGQKAALSEAVIYGGTGEGQYYSKDVEVWLSADGNNFTLAGSGTLDDLDGSIVMLDLGNAVAKQVKLIINSGYRSDYWELAEFVVKGELNGCKDADGDSYSPDGGTCGPVDCNDNDDTIYPGAAETCNSADDDCDGELDEGLICTPGGDDGSGVDEYNVYYGMLHSHTGVSDGAGTPSEAYKYARDTAKLDFFSVAEHDYYPDDMTAADWATIKNAANNYNEDGTFVTFWGFEWTSDTTEWGGPSTLRGKGHITIINSQDFCNASKEATNELNELVGWLSTRDAVAFFNHPGQYGTTFDKFEFDHSDKIVGMELWNRSTDYYTNDGFYKNDGGLGYYDEALSRGWYIGAGGSQDNHDKTWGTVNEWRMAVLAPEKTRAAILAALQARRFYSSRDKNLELSFKCNGAQMGSKIDGGSLNIQIEASDGDNENFSRIELLKNGSVIKAWTPNTTHPNLSHAVTGNEGDYFYVRAFQSNSWDAISSPIFITNNGTGGVADADGDGVKDSVDNCPNTANANQVDKDGDGIGDACDSLTDSDGDGVKDSVDNCPNTANANQADTDGDGIGNACDPLTDSDGDGVKDAADNCPNNTNADQADADGDGIGDACDSLTDSDGDGIKDAVDNCPDDANANQADTDGDGLGDVCDALTDSDGDGMPDDWEVRNGLDPNRDDASADPDQDGISNLDEYLGGTDPVVYEENDEPDAPVLYAPVNRETVGLTPQLQIEEFYDPDSGDAHRSTQWQITRRADDRVVLDVTSDHMLTTLPVPKMVLEEDTGYRWRARVYDNHGLASAWSSNERFDTDIQTEDNDGNGILDDQEVDPVLDIDEDGTADRDQEDIKCVNIQGADGQIGISIHDSPAVVAIEALESLDPSDPLFDGRLGGKPADIAFGLIHFKLLLNEVGADATVKVHLSQPAPAGSQWFKFHPIAETWLDYSDYAVISSDRRTVTLTITDGGYGDLDGIANGIIIDPSGLGTPSGSSGGSDNIIDAVDDTIGDTIENLADNVACFISAAAEQSQTSGPANPWHNTGVRLLILVCLVLTVLTVSRKSKLLKPFKATSKTLGVG